MCFLWQATLLRIVSLFPQGSVVRKPVNANLELKCNRSPCFSKEFTRQIPGGRLKVTEVKIKGKKGLQESVLFGHKTELKIDVNPGLA